MRFEPRIPGLRRLMRLSDHVEKDVNDEIAFHVDSRVDDLITAGHTRESARQIAEAEFGDLRASRRELATVDRHRRRRERIEHAFDTIAQDLRYAVRALRRSPAFTLTAIATLVIGIGAAVAIFAVVDGVLLRPLPYREPERLVGAWHDFVAMGLDHGQQTATTYWTYQSQARTIDGIGIYSEDAVNVAELSSAVPPARVASTSSSASLFRVLGVPPELGRLFT